MGYADIYFTNEYGRIFEKNGDGKLTNFSMECEFGKVYYNFLLREIELIQGPKYYDIVTPYGYGGPLFSNYKEENLQNMILAFKKGFEAYCNANNIVSEFIRFHPLIKNYCGMENYMDIFHIRDTVYMDLHSTDFIWNHMQSTCRNRIRNAQKNSIDIEINNSKESLNQFIELYSQTMDKNNAEAYYYFSKEFFYNTKELLKDQLYIFNALFENRVIASMLIMKYGDFVHYHLGGSDSQYIQLAPNNLLFYKIALWGHEQGCKYLHLGGGYRGNSDSLFIFKKTFSKDGIANFYIGKKVHNPEIYKELVSIREGQNKNRKEENLGFFPLYRR